MFLSVIWNCINTYFRVVTSKWTETLKGCSSKNAWNQLSIIEQPLSTLLYSQVCHEAPSPSWAERHPFRIIQLEIYHSMLGLSLFGCTDYFSPHHVCDRSSLSEERCVLALDFMECASLLAEVCGLEELSLQWCSVWRGLFYLGGLGSTERGAKL